MEDTLRRWQQLAISVIVLFRGNKLESFLVLYFVFCRCRQDIYSWGNFLPFHFRKNLAVLVFSFTILRVIQCIQSLFQKSTGSNGSPLKPFFFPCQTTHSRILPVRHSFSYSYLLTGIPVGFKGSVGGLISVDEDRQHSWFWRKAWFTVHGDDYLARGHHPDGLKGKLQDYLQSQGVDHTQYSHAYLLTAAKFFNYSSNPVSIWHLYSSKNELKALVLEVNNTFDERHNYFLEPSPKSPVTSSNTTQKPIRYTSTWPKNFYVSTFNDRSGCYFLSATDPFAPNLTGTGHININITLSGPSKKNAMIVTLLRSTRSPFNPEHLSVLRKILFISGWWWVGFATFPRTLEQAFKLFFRKKMPWTFRPEPKRNTISRPADETERFIEQHFRAFLRYRVENYHETLALRYQSAGLIGEKNKACIFNQTKKPRDSKVENEIVVHTPTFYSRLLLYTSLDDALNSESSEYQTVSLSEYGIISKLFRKSSTPLIPSVKAYELGSLTKPFLIFLTCLRKNPQLVPDQGTSTSTNPNVKFSKLSELDIFVLQDATPAQLRFYTWKLLRLMMIERLAFGSLIIWQLEALLARTLSLLLILHSIFG